MILFANHILLTAMCEMHRNTSFILIKPFYQLGSHGLLVVYFRADDSWWVRYSRNAAFLLCSETSHETSHIPCTRMHRFMPDQHCIVKQREHCHETSLLFSTLNENVGTAISIDSSSTSKIKQYVLDIYITICAILQLIINLA